MVVKIGLLGLTEKKSMMRTEEMKTSSWVEIYLLSFTLKSFFFISSRVICFKFLHLYFSRTINSKSIVLPVIFIICALILLHCYYVWIFIIDFCWFSSCLEKKISICSSLLHIIITRELDWLWNWGH